LAASLLWLITSVSNTGGLTVLITIGLGLNLLSWLKKSVLTGVLFLLYSEEDELPVAAVCSFSQP
jgi:hypothetical protein